MRTLRLAAVATLLATASCNHEGGGPNSTPIDSSNKNGTESGAYQNNPAKDSVKTNYGDTGTNAKNSYNTPAQ